MKALCSLILFYLFMSIVSHGHWNYVQYYQYSEVTEVVNPRVHRTAVFIVIKDNAGNKITKLPKDVLTKREFIINDFRNKNCTIGLVMSCVVELSRYDFVLYASMIVMGIGIILTIIGGKISELKIVFPGLSIALFGVSSFLSVLWLNVDILFQNSCLFFVITAFVLVYLIVHRIIEKKGRGG